MLRLFICGGLGLASLGEQIGGPQTLWTVDLDQGTQYAVTIGVHTEECEKLISGKSNIC